MAKYEKYEQKIQKIANIRGKLRRFRRLFIALFIIIAVTTVTLLATKGIMVKGLDDNFTITYGEDTDYNAKAFLSSIEYEYREKGSDKWTNEKPFIPGEYELRVVSHRSFGINSYSKISTFTISAKPISINIIEDIIEYGELPTIGADLADGDAFKSYEIAYDNIGDNQTNAQVIADSVRIVNNDGVDVTECYEIEAVKSPIRFTKRTITIDVLDAIKEYDGKPLNPSSYQISNGSIANGDVISVEYSQGITDSGSASASIIKATITHNGIDVTNNYDIKINEGNLNIVNRSLSIKTNSLKKVYDGTPIENTGYEITAGSLAEGHKLVLNSTTSFINSTKKLNVLSFSVLDENNCDVTNMYNIEYDYGTLEIEKRSLTIETASAAREYNGLPLTANNYQIIDGALAPTDELILSLNSQITNIGTIKNTVSSYQIVNSDAQDVEFNYDITFNEGTLTIYAMALNVKPLDASFIYDGFTHSSLGYELIDSNLAEGDSIKLQISGSLDKVGSVTTTITEIKIVNKNGDDVTSSYSINFLEGSLTILPRKISVRPVDITATYNGNAILPNQLEIVGDTTLAINDKIVSFVIDSDGIEPIYAGVYQVKAQSVIINNSLGENVGDCYEIDSSIASTITINKRPITIKPADQTLIYDGKEHTAQMAIVSSSSPMSLVPGDMIANVGFAEVSIINVGCISTAILSVEIKDIDNQIITDSYEITLESGNITINPREITIKPTDASKVYDGKGLVSNQATVTSQSSYTLAVGDYITIETSGSITQYGEQINTITEYSIWNEEGNEVTSNYAATLENGSLTILKRTIAIKPLDMTKVYDGVAMMASNRFEYLESSLYQLASGDNLEIVTIGQIKYAGYTNSQISEYSIYNSNSEDVSSSYEVIIEDGILTILPRSIAMKPTDSAKVYDATILASNTAELLSGYTLASGDYVLITTGTSIIDTTEVYFEGRFVNVPAKNDILSYIIFNSHGEDVTLSYDVSLASGYLSIYRREIEIKPVDVTKTYDGLPLSSSTAMITFESPYYLASSSHKIVITTDAKITLAGKVSNQIMEAFIYDADGNDISTNYNIKFVAGYLEIAKRSLEIKALDDKKIYDGLYLTPSGISYLNDTSLAQEDKLQYTYLDDPKVLNVADGIIRVSLDNVIIFNGYIDVTDSYSISITDGSLQIIAREIVIAPESIETIYDGASHTAKNAYVTATSRYPLVDGNYIVVETNSFTDATETDKIEYSQNEILGYTIFNSKNDDVTANYLVSTELGSVLIYRRPITIKAQDSSKEYDGLALVASNNAYVTKNSAYGLVEGHTINAICSGSIVNAGITSAIIENYQIFDENGDVTANYRVAVVSGTLEIYKLALEITLLSDEKEYDGSCASSSSYTLNRQLPVNHSLTLTALATSPNVSNSTRLYVDSYDILFNGRSALENFDITIKESTIRILKRNLSVKPNDLSKEYDGIALISTNYQIMSGSLVLGDTLVLESNSVINVTNGAINPGINKYSVLNIDLIDVTSNYQIEIQEFIVEITPRLIEFSINGSFIYDGLMHYANEYLVTNGSLVLDHKIEFTTNSYLIYHGIKEVYASSYMIVNGNKDVSQNYVITNIAGKLVVNQRQIVIQIQDASKIYDGTALKSSEYIITEGALADGDILTLSTDGEITNVGSVTNSLASLAIYRDGNDVSACYSYEVVDGLLEVTKRTINIYTQSDNLIYNATNQSRSVVEWDYDLAALGQTIIINSYTEVRNVSLAGYENRIDISIFNGIDDMSFNYEIIYHYGTLYVLPFTIYISTNSISVEYGSLIDKNAYTILNYKALEEILSLDGVSIVTSLEQDRASTIGISENIIRFSISNPSLEDNYQIEIVSYGNIETYINVQYTSNSIELEYDGKSHQDTTIGSITHIYSDLSLNAYVVSKSASSYINAGKYNNYQQISVYYNDIDITDYANIRYIYGSFIITPKTLIVSSDDLFMDYSGLSLDNYSDSFNVEGLCSGHYTNDIKGTSSISIIGSIAGSIEELVIYDNDGYDVTQNYSIVYDLGSLTIYGRLSIETEGMTWEYDGKEHYYDKYNIISSESSDILLGDDYQIGIEFTYNQNYPLINASKVDNNAYIKQVINPLGQDISKYIKLEVSCGSLEITKRRITIASQGLSKDFDGQNIINHAFTIDNSDTIYTNEAIINITNDKLIVTFDDSENAIYKGDQRENIFGYEIVNSSTNSYTTSNYDVVTVYGILAINGYKSALIIAPKAISRRYNGNNLVLVASDYQILQGTLPSGYHIEITTALYTDKDMLHESYTFSDAGIRYAKITSHSIYDNFDNNVTDEYDVYYQNSVLEITKNAITINPQDMFKMYDSKPVLSTDVNYYLTGGRLATGHQLSIIFEFVRLDDLQLTNNTVPGMYEIRVKEYKLVNSYGEELDSKILANYSFTTGTAVLTVMEN